MMPDTRRAIARALPFRDTKPLWWIDRYVFGEVFGALGRALIAGRADRLLQRVPVRPRFTLRVTRPPTGPWPAYERETPAALRTQPGVRRDSDAEDAAHRENPVRSFPAEATIWALSLNWRHLVSFLPTFARERDASAQTATARVAAVGDVDAQKLTREFRAEAARLGLSAIGVAPYDERYQFAEYRGTEKGDRMVIGLLEEAPEAIEKVPHADSLRTTFATIGLVNEMMVELSHWLNARGYHAYVAENQGVVIPYAVAAGLGQLGLNGQLLTPYAGSRCRPSMLSTDAPLELGAPQDFGIPAICDACQVCVRRCPSGAIPKRRFEYRGIQKAKINTARCLPLVAQAYGCAVCMRVCPVQKYGLNAVVDEYERTGGILGKGTPELEAYTWPIDGNTYPPGETPRVTKTLLDPPGIPYRPEYKKPRAT